MNLLSANLNESLRLKLCDLQKHMLRAILEARNEHSTDQLASISEQTAADVIYAIDTIADQALHQWFSTNWPHEHPVQIIMEGIEDDEVCTYPSGTPVKDTVLKCIIDPIDGTREIMYDKRSAWILTGLAPQRFESNSLQDIQIAAMTEIPTSRQWRADQISASRGEGLQCQALDVRNDYTATTTILHPSDATDVRHAFGTIIRFSARCRVALQTRRKFLEAPLLGRLSRNSAHFQRPLHLNRGTVLRDPERTRSFYCGPAPVGFCLPEH